MIDLGLHLILKQTYLHAPNREILFDKTVVKKHIYIYN